MANPLPRLRRVYEPADAGDGRRVLVDRLWPRGLTRERAAVDEWLRDIAPSDDLRRWYGHEEARWPEFRQRYFAELDANGEAVARLRVLLAEGPVTLVFAARAETRSNAVAIREYLAAADAAAT